MTPSFSISVSIVIILSKIQKLFVKIIQYGSAYFNPPRMNYLYAVKNKQQSLVVCIPPFLLRILIENISLEDILKIYLNSSYA